MINMTKLRQVYRCDICGNIVEVLHEGVGQLVCCGQLMGLMTEKTEDVGQEKHMPVVEKTNTEIKVSVGSIPHPMEDKHYIEWIEIIANGKTQRKFLNPGDKPEATFVIKQNDEKIKARAYCNVHGLWLTH